MAQGRGSASVGGVAILLLVCMLAALTKPTNGAVYTVGGNGGWTFNVNNWPNGKSFKAGDVLAFNYDKTIHNVVSVGKKGYDSCSSSSGDKVFQSGKDRLRLRKGPNYFICTFTGHCQSGMKITVNAA